MPLWGRFVGNKHLFLVGISDKQNKDVNFMETAINQTDFSNQTAVPVGAILPFLGSLNNLPENWEPCDGRLIHDGRSPFNQQRVPNLMDDRFLMGVSASNSVGQYGGNNSLPADGQHNPGGLTDGSGGYQ